MRFDPGKVNCVDLGNKIHFLNGIDFLSKTQDSVLGRNYRKFVGDALKDFIWPRLEDFLGPTWEACNR